MANILVTGGSGFIGSAVARTLASRGGRVAVFDVNRSLLIEPVLASYPDVEFVGGQLTEWPHIAAAMQSRKPDAVIHCAAIVGVSNSLASPIGTFRTNVDGSLNVLEAMRLFGVKRFIHLSSEETYGPFDAPIIDETHPNRPRQPYGISKYAAERLACDYTDSYGIECVHIRTCWVYGPGLPRPRVPKTLIDAAVSGQKLHIASGGDFRVDHVYIDDCVDGILRALGKPKHRFDVYHIATGRAPSLFEIVEIIKTLVPGADLTIGPGNYRFVDGTEAVRKGALDISRARAELGYSPRFPIEAGLAAYIEAARYIAAKGREDT